MGVPAAASQPEPLPQPQPQPPRRPAGKNASRRSPSLVLALVLASTTSALALDGTNVSRSAPTPTPTLTAPGDTGGDVASSAEVGPWRVGAVIDGGWTVAAIERHDEYIRVAFRTGNGVTGQWARIELVARPSVVDAFCTERHRLQPAPGESPDEAFVLLQVALLRRWEQGHPEVALVSPPRAKAEPASASGRVDPAQPDATGPNWPRPRGGHDVEMGDVVSAWHVTWALLPLLSLLLALAYARLRPDLRRSLIAASAWSLFVPLAAWWAAASFVVPVDWITPLHEGTTEFGIRRLYGEGIHSERAHFDLVFLLARNGGIVLPALAKAHALIGIANAALLFAIVLHVQRGWGIALLLAAELVGSSAIRNAALSELPSTLCHFAMLHGAIGWLIAWRPEAPGWLRTVAWTQVSLATALLAATRPELALLGTAAVASALWERQIDAATRVRWFAAAMAWMRDVVRLRRPVTLALIALVVCAVWVVGDRLSTMLRLPFPMPGEILATLQGTVAEVSLATVVLLALGVRALWRGGTRTMWILATIAVWLRLYWVYGHNGNAVWELWRYGTYWTPLLLLIAAAGAAPWRQTIAGLRLQRGSHGVLALLTVVALLGQVTMSSGMTLAQLQGPTRHVTAIGMMAFDSQLETRMWLRQLEATPECVIVARVTDEILAHRDRRDATSLQDAWLAFGGRLPHPIRLPAADSLDAALDATLPTGTCVLLGRGIDCALVPSIGCQMPDGPPLQRVDVSDRPWTHEQHAPLQPPVVLGVWPLRQGRGAPAIPEP